MPTPQFASHRARAFVRQNFLNALLLLLPLIVLGVVLFPSVRTAGAEERVEAQTASNTNAHAPSNLSDAYGKLPLQFEANRGQTDERVRFISRGDGYVMFLTPDEAVLTLRAGGAVKAQEKKQAGGYRVLRMKLTGASANPKVEGQEELPGKLNYYIGNNPSEWRTGVPVYGRVHYVGVYPGIDLVYYGNQRQLEYDFQVAPGADPRAIRIKFEGAERAVVDKKDGSLTLFDGDSEVRMKRPVIYQVGDDGSRHEVEGGYRVRGSEVEFSVGLYDAKRPLVIDPVLSYSTYLGAVSNFNATSSASLTLDSSNNAYITGATGSLAFPAPGVKLVPVGSFSSNVFITKLNPTGTALIYTSYLGGFSDEVGLGIAVDSAGGAYVTGKTQSSDFPITAGALRANDDLIKSADGGAMWQASNAGLQNRAILRMAADPVAASTLYAVAFNGVYKTADAGASWSLLNTGLVSPGSTNASTIAVAPSNPSILYAGNQGSSASVAKSTDGGATWAPAKTGLPGNSIAGLGVDPTNPSVALVGLLFSSDTYKTIDGGANWTKAGSGLNFGGVQTFVFDPTNTQIVYAQTSGGPIYKTTNGGTNWTQVTNGITTTFARALVIDPTNPSTLYAASGGTVYKTTDGAANWTPITNGLTNLTAVSLAIDPAAPSTLYAGTSKGGVFKTTNGGTSWTQVHSGMGGAQVSTLAVSASSHVYAGIDNSSFPDLEAFVVRLSPAGDTLVYSTYLGGFASDEGDAVAVDASGNAHVVGQTFSTDFPIAGPRTSSLQGGNDAFVTKLNSTGTSLLYSTLVGGSLSETGRSVALDSSGNAYVCGETSSSNFPATPGAFSTTFGGNQPFPSGFDGYVFKLDAAGSALSYATYLGGNGEDRATDIAVDASGNAYVAGSTTSSTFPALNAVQPNGKGNFDAFAAKLNSNGSALVYSTYLGGTESEFAQSIALDPSGAAYLTGTTGSNNFPVTPGTLKNRSQIYKTMTSGASWSNDNYGLDLGSGAVREIVLDPTSPLVIYAGTDNGVFKSTNGGRTWAAASNGLASLRVNALAIDAQTPTTLYASVGFASFNTPTIFKTTDGGANWSPLASSSAFSAVGYIAVDPLTPANVYIFNGNNVVKSTNGGASWGAPGNGSPNNVNTITIDPSNSSIVYAAANNNSGIYKTTDGGANWAPAVNGFTGLVSAGRVAIDPAHPSTLYANTTAGIYKTTDGAANWTLSLKGNGISRHILVDPSDTSTVYAYVGQLIAQSNLSYSIYRTTDGGASWSALNNGVPYPLTALAIDPLTRTNLYAGVDTFSVNDGDAFVLKLAPSGSTLAYSTLLGGRVNQTFSQGGSVSDQGTAIAVDAQGAAYVTGVSFTSDFPVTPGSFIPANRTGLDLFVTKLITAPAIGGVVADAGSVPRQGVKISLTGSTSGTQFTGADGTYLFPNLAEGGTYTVSATKAGSSFTPPTYNFTNLTSDQTANFTAGAGVASHKIAGRLTESNGTPLSGATVALNGSQTELTTTDANGNYLFNAPDGGSYTVTPSALGFSFSPASGSVNNLASDQTRDFTAARQDFVVTNTNDIGAGSLRQAMLDANTTPGRDRIAFNIPGAGVHTISPNTLLPTVTDPVTIDGTTQPGYVGLPLVELNGTNVLAPSTAAGLNITGGDSVVRGLAINRFGGSGIFISGAGGNHVEGCVVGLDPTGNVKRPNKANGVTLSSNTNIVGGTTPAQRNIISGNDVSGIFVGSAGNLIKGNYVGTDATGMTALGNGGSGVSLFGSNGGATDANIVGGTEPGARNVISGQINSGGIDANAPNSIIQGNYIGTDAAGTGKLPNQTGIHAVGTGNTVGGTTPEARNIISGNGTGVLLSFFSNTPAFTLKGNYIGTDVTGTVKLGNGIGIQGSGAGDIGGTEPGAGNLISGNDGDGILLNCCGPAPTIKGNYIGTDATGTQPLGNGTGVDIQSSLQVVGGSETGARNVISGNNGVGIAVGGFTSSGPNVIRGNLIGLNAAGTGPLPNFSHGITLNTFGGDTVIGGDAPGEANTIAFNGGAGVIVNSSAVNNSIRGNAIFSNGQLGIDLFDANSAQYVNRNDAGDADEGGNHLQNFPIVNSFANVAGGTNVKGTLNSKPSTPYRIDFYASYACDTSGNGEGAVPLGSTGVTTDATGNVTFDATLAGQLAQGRIVTATATDNAGNTSEFSPCDASNAKGSIEFSYGSYTALEDVGSMNIRVLRKGGSRGALTVNYATGGGTATPGADYTPVSGQLTFADGETEKSFSIPIASDNVTEISETVGLSLTGVADLDALGSNGRATLNIFDADTPLSFSVENADFFGIVTPEGDTGRKNVIVNVRLLGATSRTTSVDYSIPANSGLATPGLDYIPVSGTLTFAPGVETREIVIPILGDTIDEFSESFDLVLSNPVGATITTSPVTVTIVDDDDPPTVSVTDVTVREGAGAKAAFAIRLSQPSGKGATITFSTADGTATANSDYTPLSGSVNFSVGQTIRIIEVSVLTDAVAEGDETFFLNINSTSPTRAVVADNQGQSTIKDASSSASLVQFSASTYSVNEADGQAVITVTRTGDTSQAASVDYRTVSQSANERSDFTASLGTLRFAAGETQKTFNVLVTDDRFFEPAEPLDLVLSNAAGASLGGPSVVALIINSNDTADGQSPVREASFDTTFFVRQHYHDFLNREPDAAGLQFWVNDIEGCGANQQCREVKKINVSAAFFLSIEFQETGYLVYRTYKAAYGVATSPNVAGTVPVVRLQEFLPDSQRIGQNVQVGIGNWEQQLEANKQAYMLEFVQRQRFLDAFPLSLTPAQFVDKLNQNSGGVLSQPERDALVAELAGSPDQTQGRAAALRKVADDADMRAGEKNRAFVLMQYYGYLRRNPDDPQDVNFAGWKFWLDKLNQFNGNFVDAEMVKAFITSIEYTERFGR